MGYIFSALLFILAAVLKFLFRGYGFLALLLVLIGITILILQLLSINENKVKRTIKKLIYSIISFGIICATVAAIPITANFRNKESQPADYCLILGCAVHGSNPSRVLNERICAGYEYLNSNPECRAVLCGGKGNGENISEAECIFNCLVQRGISPDRLVLEDKSTNTSENIRFAKELLPEKATVTVITSETHSYRACFLAKRNGLNVVGRYNSKTHFPVIISNYLRECVGVWKDWIIK